MSAFNWIKKLRKDERGNVLVVGAATMPLLMGSAALAIDTVQLTLWKRQLQRTADSAAIAGAYALSQSEDVNTAVNNDLDENIDTNRQPNERPMLTTTDVDTGSFRDGTLSAADCAVRGPVGCFQQAVQVDLTAERTLPFMSMFTSSSSILRAEATAALIGSGTYCMVSLFDGPDPGIIAGGNSNLALGCGMITNSTATNAVRAHGAASLTSDPVAAVGGIDGGSHFVQPTTLQPYSVPAKDPFADRVDPVKPSNCSTNKLEVPNGATVTLNLATDPHGGCYAGWDVKGTLNLVGTPTNQSFFVDNALLDLKGAINGTGTIVLLGDNSDLKQNGGGQLNITAATVGNTKDIAMWRDRNAANVTIKINGGADTNVLGAFYLPSSDVWIGGNADINAACLQLVGRILTFKGGGSITNVCPAGGPTAFQQTVVRLVA